MKNISFFFKLGIAFCITIILLFLIFQYIKIEEIGSVFGKITCGTIVFLFFLYLLHYLLKTLRMQLFLHNKIHVFPLFLITCIHNMFVNLLPFKLGEYTFCHLTKKNAQIPLSESITALIAARLFDSALLLFFSLLTIFFIISEIPILQTLLPYIIILLLILLIALLLLLLFHKQLIHILEQKKEKNKKNSIRHLFFEKIIVILVAFNKIWVYQNIFGGLCYSIGIVFTYYIQIYLLLHTIGLKLQLLHIIFIFSIIPFFSFLPIQGIAGFGSIEAIWSLIFIWYGIPVSQAISSVFVMHVILLSFSVFFGITSFFSYEYIKKYKT